MNEKLTSKEYAQKQLGNLDLSHLDKERDVARDIYGTSSKSLDTNFGYLMDQIDRSRQDYRKGFNTGRGTIAENAFTQNRLHNLDIGSRVAGRSGLSALGQVGNRIETGRQYSDLANTFYNEMDNIGLLEKQGRSQYDLDKESLTNVLNQALTGIDSKGAESTNAWNTTLAQLAEQVQGRWDSNKNAADALAQARAAAAQANTNAQKAMKTQLQQANRDALMGLIEKSGLAVDKKGQVDRQTAYNTLLSIQSMFGVDADTARSALGSLGLLGQFRGTGQLDSTALDRIYNKEW